jgi:hypothetical protein
LALISKFDTALGYQFNRYLVVEGGVPLYVVRPSSTTPHDPFPVRPVRRGD